MPADPTRVTELVASFYDELPFNYLATGSGAALIRERNQVRESYPDLDTLLRAEPRPTVLDVGCGTGWLSNTCAYHYGCRVTGIDLSEKALERARAISLELGLAGRVAFLRRDLFEDARERFDLVASLGVLHHTHELAAALRHVARAVAEGGALYLGLYHSYGRRPFLDLFERERERHRAGTLTDAELEEAVARYRELNPHVEDEEFLLSWFRDQVLHPHETQHSLEEVHGLLGAIGFEIRSTSINGFEPFESIEPLFARERALEEHSRRRNLVERRYFPGFFTVRAARAG